MKEKTFTLLDGILKYVYDNQDKKIIINDVRGKFSNINEDEFYEALKHLKQDDLIDYVQTKSQEYNSISLTTKGKIECEYNGFQKKHTRNLIDRRIVIASFIISVISLIVSVIALC